MASTPHAHPALQHHFDSLEQQKESATLGMWLFLVTEIMFFGGLILAYIVYRQRFHGVFAAASSHLETFAGFLNTLVLIGSSVTMALAVWAAQTDRRKWIVRFLILTILLGSVFLGVKAFEYKQKFDHHLIPGPSFNSTQELGADPGVETYAEIFFSLYFCMTGLHALHMVIGIGVLVWMAIDARRGRFGPSYYNPLECAGLYWHFVDIVWIFLFPLLYLLGAHQGGGPHG